ncbi:MAG: hypothetical protein QG671_4425 [Actinomycetota bacterium]|nr:hypothetical protein [Actinomycetota bacterium]
MTRRRVHVAVSRLSAHLPEIPTPWDVDELCEALQRRRRRPLLVHSLNLPSLPFGLWYNDGQRDHIIHREGVTGYHRDHIILHEVCHMLSQDNTVASNPREKEGHLVEGHNEVIRQAWRGRYSTVQEEIAETFASTVLRLACGQLRRPASGFEQRAAAMFGVG